MLKFNHFKAENIKYLMFQLQKCIVVREVKPQQDVDHYGTQTPLKLRLMKHFILPFLFSISKYILTRHK